MRNRPSLIWLPPTRTASSKIIRLSMATNGVASWLPPYVLEANGIRFNGSERDAVIQTIALAAGESTLQDFSAWLERATITPPAE